MSKEAMKLALESLERVDESVVLGEGGHLVVLNTYAAETVSEAITALREALAEQYRKAMQDAIVGGTGIMKGGERIDPASIYAEQPAQQEPVAEVKAKMTGGNVGIATVIHEIYSPLREPLQPGDKLYPAYRWIGWDVEQVWSERIFGIDMRFENVGDAIAFRKKLDESTTPQPPAQPQTDADYYNACLSYRHDFGLMSEEERQKLVFEAKEWARAFGITKGNT